MNGLGWSPWDIFSASGDLNKETASPEFRQKFEDARRLWERVNKEVLSNPRASQTCRNEALKLHNVGNDEQPNTEGSWTYFATRWDAGADINGPAFDAHVALLNGLAKECIEKFNRVEEVHGQGADQTEHEKAQWVDRTAPGGAPSKPKPPEPDEPKEGLATGPKAALYVLGGLVLVLGGVVLGRR